MTEQTDFATPAHRNGAQHAPGSPQAVACGCKCPVMDNHYGAGVAINDGIRYFVMNEACPLHGWLTAKGEEA